MSSRAWLVCGDEDGAVGLVGGDGGGGAVQALTVRLGDVGVFTDGTGKLIVVGLKALFQAFGVLKPILCKNQTNKLL